MSIRTSHLKRGDVIQVEWGDAWGQTGWHSVDDEKCKPMDIVSIGIFVRQNRKGLIMSIGLDEEGKANGMHFVPRGMFQNIKVLKKGKHVKLTQ